MAKSLEEMSPEELSQLADSFKGIMHQDKSDSVGVTAPAGSQDSQDNTTSDDLNTPSLASSLMSRGDVSDLPPSPQVSQPSPSLFQMASDKYKEKTPEMTSPTDSGEGIKGPSPASVPSSPMQAQEQPQLQAPQGPSIMDRYKDAQQRANLVTMMNQMGKAGSKIGSGISAAASHGIVAPTTVDDKPFDTNIALAQQIPEQVVKQIAMEREDPASKTSASARDFLKNSIGVKVPDNISASQLKEQFPVIEKFLQSRENAQARAETARQHNELMASLKNEGNDRKDKTSVEKIVENTRKSRSEPDMNVALTSKALAEKALVSLQDPKTGQIYSDLNNIPPEQLALFKGELAKFKNGASSTDSTYRHAIFPSLDSTLASGVGFFDPNSPSKAGPQVQQAVQVLQNTINQAKQHVAKKISGQAELAKKYGPEHYNTFKSAIKSEFDVDPDNIQGSTQNTQSPPSSNPRAGSIVKVKGKTYRVGADGDSLEEIQQ